MSSLCLDRGRRLLALGSVLMAAAGTAAGGELRVCADRTTCPRPWNMALTPDGAKLYVACGRRGTVAVVADQALWKRGH